MDNRRSEANMNRHWPLLLAIVVAVACRSTVPPTTPQAQPTPAPSPAIAPAPLPAVAAAAQPSPTPAPARLPEAIRWVRDSAEHRALFLQVYREATEHVEREAAKHVAGAWAVVLDVDETVLDNSAYEAERVEKNLPFDAPSWHEWVARRQAVPLPGAAAFLARVHALGGKIAIVTNRGQSECPDTEAVFRAQGLVFDAMLCKPDGSPSDKNPRFEAIARGTTAAGLPPLEIVEFLGDNILDFPGLSQAIVKQPDDAFTEFGVRFFVLPNPMYGSWN
jgi:5'-nucleotidase (lipoprotein e(P4) family)